MQGLAVAKVPVITWASGAAVGVACATALSHASAGTRTKRLALASLRLGKAKGGGDQAGRKYRSAGSIPLVVLHPIERRSVTTQCRAEGAQPSSTTCQSPSFVEEILARLPSKDVFRCRAVRKSWRSATSTSEFIVAHHQLWPVVRTSRTSEKLRVEAACDGLLVVSVGMREKDHYICNPANRQYAPLLQLPRCPFPTIGVAGFYRHHPPQEFRVLYWSKSEDMDEDCDGQRS
ncbi:hypothetical protein D1007_34001 [Hordeum vulgare]|nr:hypothetical protein D1007_34001 [Hordeum vulgare]